MWARLSPAACAMPGVSREAVRGGRGTRRFRLSPCPQVLRSSCTAGCLRVRTRTGRCPLLRLSPRSTLVVHSRLPPGPDEDGPMSASATVPAFNARRAQPVASGSGPGRDCPSHSVSPGTQKTRASSFTSGAGQSHPGPALRANRCVGHIDGTRERTRTAPLLERSRSARERGCSARAGAAQGRRGTVRLAQVKEEARLRAGGHGERRTVPWRPGPRARVGRVKAAGKRRRVKAAASGPRTAHYLARHPGPRRGCAKSRRPPNSGCTAAAASRLPPPANSANHKKGPPKRAEHPKETLARSAHPARCAARPAGAQRLYAVSPWLLMSRPSRSSSSVTRSPSRRSTTL
jgi:hypothetical protein